MAWKKDDKGNFAADEAGNPIWTGDSGDKAVDYAALSAKLSEVNAESKGRKEELRKLKEKYAAFSEIEDLEAWRKDALEAIEYKKNAGAKDQEKIEAMTAPLKAQVAERDRKLGERDKSIAELTERLNRLLIADTVKSSKLLNERIKPDERLFVEREMRRAGTIDKEGKPYFRYDDGEAIYGENGYASIDEAIPLFLRKLGIDPATKLMSQNTSTGSGGNPNPGHGGGGVNPWKKETKNVTEQMRIYAKNPAEAERLMREAQAR